MRPHTTSTLRIKHAIFASIVALASTYAPFAHAEDVVGGIDMQTFDAQISVDANAHVTVVETITGAFQTPHHGIFRTMPYRYDVDGASHVLPMRIMSVTNLSGAAQKVAMSQGGGNVTLKIGDADSLLTGPFAYVVTYEIDRAVLARAEGAFFSWDVPGDAWEDPFERVTTTVHYVGGEGSFAHPLTGDCFIGAFGATDTRCAEMTLSDDYQSATFTSDVPMTVAVTFDPTAVVVPPETWWYALWTDHGDVVFFAVPLLAFGVMCAWWWRRGRDPKGTGVVIPEYEPPKGMGPAEVGAVYDGRVHKRDIVAMIVDLAVRGYVVIEDTKGAYALTRTEKSADSLCAYESAFLSTTFGGAKTVDLSEKQTAFGKAWKAAQSAVYVRLQHDGMFVRNPQTVRTTFVGFGGLLFGLTWVLVPRFFADPALPFAAGVLTALVVGLFGLAMPQRTPEGVRVLTAIRGYRLFLHTAERYRLQWQEREGIFEKYLPYALALGVADAWVKALGPTLTEPPEWYHGDWSTWSTWSMLHHINSFSGAMERSYAKATTSSHSGGGGFSGGGFGGGGGGGW